MKTNAILPLLLLLLIQVSHAQITIVYTGEPAMLVAGGMKHGSIQWQRSTNKLLWNDVPGWTHDSLQFTPDTIPLYYRAVITSGSCDTLYSDVIGIKLFQCGDTIIDYRDGKAYPTVRIGSQCWIGKNMSVGTMINGGTDMNNNGIIERYCYNNDTAFCNIFGALYQWDEMMQYSSVEGAQGICPKGWHIPTDQEVMDLEQYLGMDAASVTMINMWRGTNQGWQLSPSGTSGFNANYTGVRYDGGLFYNQSTFEFLYTSSTNTANTILAWRRCLSTGDNTIGRFNNTLKTTGASVRCLKNQ